MSQVLLQFTIQTLCPPDSEIQKITLLARQNYTIDSPSLSLSRSLLWERLRAE